MSSPVVWVYDDPARGLALLRGGRVPDLLAAAEMTNAARWSLSGHGHVIVRDLLPDLLARAQQDHIPVRIKAVVSQ